MKILAGKSHKGSNVKGECVMLDRYGDVYECIDNAYHPNAGPKEDGYPEIERVIDWLCQNCTNKRLLGWIKIWVNYRVAYECAYGEISDFNELVLDVMYCDTYTPCNEIVQMIKDSYEACKSEEVRDEYLSNSEDEAKDFIVNYLNENFLRVRAGGKLNPEGANAIYFRISSHGYDWYDVIVDFLWDAFGNPKNMPYRIWIGHDEETNPPEVVLFDGTPDELLEATNRKIAASEEIIWL